MRIQHNITALSAANKLKSNESTVSKNIQKLSSGYRINSAADDAAGLAVSEKMRKQINGLSQAEDNTKNGISLIQTAEGGLNETSAILQRMNTLAVEASNGTYKDTDRANLQMEVKSLETEIDRISTSTKFNEISLLDGSLSGTKSASSVATFSGIPTGALGTVTSAKAESDNLTNTIAASSGDTVSYTVNYTDASGKTQSEQVSYTATALDNATTVATNIATAMKSDSNLSNLFSISDDGAGKISFVANDAGTGKGQITSFSATQTSSLTPAATPGTGGASQTAEVDTVANVLGGGTNTVAAGNGTMKAGDVVSYTVNYTDTTGGAKSATVTYTAKDKDNEADVAAGIEAALAKVNDFKAAASSGILTAAVDGADASKIDFTSSTAGTANKQKITSVTASVKSSAGAAVTRSTKGTDAFQTLDMTKFNPQDSSQNSFTVNGQKFAFVNSADDAKSLPSSESYVVIGTSLSTLPSATDQSAMAALIQQKTGLKTDISATTANTIDVYGTETAASTSGVTFQVGAENVDDQRASLSIGNMNSANLNLTAINISGQEGAKAAIDIISKASAQVSTTRAQLGALQNELEHTANNLSVMNENLTSAESTIRDVDMTDEYVQYSKNQILSQAANSMLAQANAQPQNVLTLLKG